MEDSTKETILSLIQTLLKVNIGPEIFTYKEFQEFINSDRIPYLKISYLPSSNKLILITSSANKQINEHDLTLTFYKINNNLSFSNFFSNTNITFTQDSFSNLLNSEIDANIIHNLKNDKNRATLVSYIENFKDQIASIEKKFRDEKIFANEISEDNYSIINSPADEIDFWKISQNKNPNDIRINNILEIYQKVEKFFLPSYEILPEKCAEIFPQIIGCVEDLITKIVPKMSILRLKHFLTLSLDLLSAQISNKLNELKNDSKESVLKLIEIQKGLNFTKERIHILNGLYFRDAKIALDNSLFAKLDKKVHELIEIKQIFNEVQKIIPDFNPDKLTQQNSNEDVLKLLDNTLDNSSNDIVSKLNNEVFDTGNHVLMVLRDMNHWRGILNRAKFQALTYDKRADVLKNLNAYLKELYDIYKNKQQAGNDFLNEEDGDEKLNEKNIVGVTKKISLIISAHMLKQKCANCKKLSQNVLADINEYKHFEKNADNLVNEINNFIDDNLNDWNNSYSSLQNELPKLGSDIVEIDKKTGFLKVNFSEKLFNLIQDVRLLTELGYHQKIDKNLYNLNNEGKKILKDAISLKQISNFYNSLSSQVIPSQKPMLVKCAKEFEMNLTVATKKFKSENSKLDLENYVNLVQSAANTLTNEIRKLKKSHSNILDLLCQLFNYDLISNKFKWKEILTRARDIFDEVATNYKAEPHLLTDWRNHWNFQLYKILKIQYSISLEKFYSFVTEVPCEFVIQHRSLNLNPAIEDIKKSIFREIEKFLEIPNAIRNFKDDENHLSYYHTIVEENQGNIKQLYEKLNNAIEELNQLKLKLSEIVGLSYLDFESFIEKNFTSTEDWKYNYDIIRNKRKEIEKLDDIIKIDCFKINITNYKIFVSDAFEKIFDTLGSTLKEHLAKTMRNVDEFVKDSMEKMNKKANNLQEILEFKKNFVELSKKKFEFKKSCDECEKMNNLLIQLTGQSVNLSNLTNRWNNFDVMLGGFSDMLEEQKQQLKVEQNKKINSIVDNLDKFHSKFTAVIPPDNYMPDKDTDIKQMAKDIKNVYNEWDAIDKEVSDIIQEMNNFEIPVENDLSKFNNIKNEVTKNKQKWGVLFEFNDEIDNMSNEEWLGIRHKAFGIMQDFVLNWNSKIKKMEKNFIYFHINKQLNEYKQSLPVYKYLIGDNFERDHWKSLFNMLKFDNKITKENLKFGNFIEKNEELVKKQNDIKDLYQRAQGEILIRNAMSELAAWFETAEFHFTENVNQNTQRKTPLIKDWKELMSDISDKQALLVSVKTSEYFSRFEDQIQQYENKFSNLENWLTDLNLIQRKWVYLEPIFSRGALPKEQSRFKRIDDEFRNIVIMLNQNLKVTSIFQIIGIQNTLNMLIDQLEKCQKALNDFLEDKRNKFARLYFIGDDDLLEFLANSKDKGVIKNNLRKLYQGIVGLNFEGDNRINEMLSGIDEVVKLNKNVAVGDELESWLNDLTNEMRKTLHDHLNRAVNEFIKKNNDFSFLDIYCSQICALIEMIKFNYSAVSCIKKGNLQSLFDQTKNTIEGLSVVQAKSGSNNVKLFKIKNLMLDLIHNREVSSKLISNSVSDPLEWTWFSQLKYSFDSGKNFIVSMCDGDFTYTFEYQGAGQKLVHTPLTDKCYLTLTQALRLGYGGNPYGPAGTGKTESVKALGQAFGRQVLVFNCDEGIDFKAMGRIFIGLTKSGAWGCFDEFNRLLEEQLSAISIQIQIIQFALKNRIDSISLLNQNVNVDFNSCIYVTMNPACKGYGGRSKLPDNLKILFRPVAMSVPDNLQIAQTLLYAEGFKNGEILSKKVTTLFTLCKQGLSYQQHYDWGLRALKTILTVASQQIQNYLNEGKVASYEEETSILIKAIRINVLSKLTFSDSQIFNLLIRDVFPNIDMSDIVYENLNKALMESYKSLNYEFIESQFKKVVQFYEACRQRMGVVIVGPSGCGKSAIWKLLQDAFIKMNQKIVIHIINPKAMSRKLLLGYMNHDTGEYTYGVLTKCAREVEKESSDTKCWIICDGDVDPEWIEALNSVLDDNRLLTMQNGERINFGNNVNFIFETDSLKFASPATVSRMGIIYMNQEDLDIKSIYNSWISKTLKENGEVIKTWFDNFFMEIYTQYRENYNLMLNTTNYGSIQNFLSIFNYIFKDEKIDPKKIGKSAFADSIIKGLGGNLENESHRKFANNVYQITGERPSNIQNGLDVYYDIPSSNLVDFEFEGLPDEIEIKNFLLKHPIVKTTNTQMNLSIIEIWLDNNEPFIVVGPEGAGKSLLINHAISKLRSCEITTLNCTSQTNSTNIIQKLLQSCTMSNTSRGKCLRPKDSQKLILYLKDINLPKPDKYNTIQLISFLQNIVAYQGFYDENLEFVYLERIQIIASMNPSSTIGRFEITTRFTGNVRMLFLDYPNNEDLTKIYDEYLKKILDEESLGKKTDYSKSLAHSSINLYNNVKKTFTFDQYPHYIFTPRDVSNWLIGLLRYECKNDDELLCAWAYESMRIFRDKLVGSNSKKTFDNFLNSEIAKLSSTFKLKEKVDLPKLNSILFSSLDNDNNMLAPIKQEEYKEILQKGQMIYERDNDDLHMTYFEENFQNCKIIDRIITKDFNNLLLIGSYAVGRKKSVRVTSSAKHFEQFTISLTKDFGIKDFKKNIKDLFNLVATEGRTTVFIIEMHHIVTPVFMEYINSLLCSGEVPSLFTKDEQETFLSAVMPEFKEQNEFRTVYDFFTNKIKKNLKICILLDFDNKDFNQIILNNPALVTHCNVVWFNETSSFSQKQLVLQELKSSFETLLRNKIINKEEIKSLMKSFNDIFDICKSQNIITTNGKFLQFIMVFKNLINEKLSNSSSQQNHLQNGLNKLEEAEKFVETLKEKSNTQKTEIENKQKEAKQSLNQITEAMSISKQKKDQLNVLNQEIQENRKKVEAHKSEVEDQLKDVMPEVEKAQNLVKKIDSGALAEITIYFRKPILPQEVYYILKAMLQLIGHNDLSEYQIKQTFNYKSILSLQNFNIKNLSVENADKVKKYVLNNPNCFNRQNVERINLNLAKISEFVKAVLKFYDVKLKIRPLEQALIDAENKLNQSQKIVDKNTNEIKQIELKVKEYEEKYAKLTGEAEVLKIEMNKTTDLLTKAVSLLGKLTGEKNRWAAQIEELKINNEMIPFNTILSSAFITFLGYYNESVREKLYKMWLKTLDFKSHKNNTVSLINFLLNESDILKLKFNGLPTDTLSMENALIIDNSVKTVFIIDPVTKATEWFKKSVQTKTNQFDLVSLHDAKLLTNVELAIRFGKTLVINDVDTIEPFLVPLLRNEKFKRGPTNVIKLGEKVIEIHEKFKLYLVTRDSSIEISNNVLASISVVNFTVTRSGLESILLGLTIDIEQPELERQKNKLLEEQDQIKLQLSEIEKKLLEELIHLEGNLLENKQLIDSLEQSKEKSIQSEEILKKSLEQSNEIEDKRNKYKNLSQLATTIYILLQDLYKINPMYQFSLDNFMNLFKNTIQTESEKNFDDMNSKLKVYENSLIKNSFVYYSRSLFKSDLLVFGLFYIKTIFAESQNKSYWDFLLGNIDTSKSQSQAPKFLAEDRKGLFSALKNIFPDLANLIANSENWYKSSKPEEQFDNLNGNTNNLKELDKLLLIQVTRPDRLESALKNFICNSLQLDSLVPPQLSMNNYLELNPDNSVPIMFLTTLGSDPSKDLEELAIKNVGRENYIEIPMGAGDTESIIEKLKDANENGKWITLKNIHLAVSWLPTLEKEIKSLTNVNEKFRLFLTSETHNKMSPILLQSCIKYTYETPPGVKKNMERIYQQWQVDLLPNIHNERIMQSLFALAFIHAILQERRTYIPQGWSKFYEFSYSDLKVSTEIIIEYLNKDDNNESVWKNIKGLIKGTFYGGRIDNDFDFNVMSTYIDEILDKRCLYNSGNNILNNNDVPVILSRNSSDYVDIIKSLPENDNPLMFGLPLNVDRSVQRYVSTQVLNKLSSIYSISSDTKKFDKEVYAEKLAPLLNMWRSIFQPDLIDSIKSQSSRINSKDPITLFIKSESTQICDLGLKVQANLHDINSALTGHALITSQVIKNCQNLLQNVVPEDWSNIWDGPEIPSNYLKSLAKKLNGLNKYIQGAKGDLLSIDINLSEFLHPEAFINALRQKSAREMKTPIDELEITCEFSETKGVVAKINGIFLQGADFDGKKLIDIKGNQSEIVNMPICFFKFVKNRNKNKNEIEIPLYENLFREHFICQLGLQFSGNLQATILKGIALCLDQ